MVCAESTLSPVLSWNVLSLGVRALLCSAVWVPGSSALGPRLVPHAPIIIVSLLSHLHDFLSWPCVKMDSLFKDQF